MKTIYLLLLLTMTSCSGSIFVITVKDIVGLVFLGILILVVTVMFIKAAISDWKNKRKCKRQITK